jgi:hypothetical protein
LDTEKLQWSKLNPGAEAVPSKCRSRNLSFSPEHNVFILEISNTNNRPELWTYRYANASTAQRPAAPNNLEVVARAKEATLTWIPITAPEVKSYHVYRAQAEHPWLADFQKIGVTAGTTFADQGLTPGQVYFYVVKTVLGDGTESQPSHGARTQPRTLTQPVVSVLTTNRIEVSWNPHPARDNAGYNVYRGLASVKTIRKGEPGAWKDNDPEYAEPQVVKVTDITGIRKLNDQLVSGNSFADSVDLTRKGPEAADYKYAVYAYIIRAVNNLGVESGPSPYALTIPSEPINLLCRERGGHSRIKVDSESRKRYRGLSRL